MGLRAEGDQIGRGTNMLNTHSGGMLTQVVFGKSCSIMVADREAGYHSRPHKHRSEQINYVTHGEIWVFVEYTAFLVKKGDFYRIPSDAVHWGWNRGSGPVGTVQAFSPPVDPFTRRNAVGLFDELEDPVVDDHSRTVYIEDETSYTQFEAEFFKSHGMSPAAT